MALCYEQRKEVQRNHMGVKALALNIASSNSIPTTTYGLQESDMIEACLDCGVCDLTGRRASWYEHKHSKMHTAGKECGYFFRNSEEFMTVKGENNL